MTNEQIANHRVDAGRLVSKIHQAFKTKKNVFFTDDKRGYKKLMMLNSSNAKSGSTSTSISCWPLLGSGQNGLKPSAFIENTTAVGFYWGLPAPSDLSPDTTLTAVLEKHLNRGLLNPIWSFVEVIYIYFFDF